MDIVRINRIKVGEYRTNCYLVTNNEKETVIIDPGADAQKIIEELEKDRELNVKYILLTHGHFDHLMAVDDLKFKYPRADVIIGEDDIPLLEELSLQGLFVGKTLHGIRSKVVAVSDGSILPYSDGVIKVIATSGHSRGGVCYLIGNHLFSGDTLFFHTVGRTDLPESNEKELKKSVDKLLSLNPDIQVLPGHGIETSIEEEKNFGFHFN